MDQQLKANPNEINGVLSNKIAELTHGLSEMDVSKESSCTARKGVITSLDGDRESSTKTFYSKRRWQRILSWIYTSDV